MPWLPESPRWLLAKGKTDQAWDVVRMMHVSNDDPDHEFATAEFFQMKRQHELDRSLDSSWIVLFTRPSYRKRALIAFFLPIILYSTGNLVVTSKPPFCRICEELTDRAIAYAASIFTELGYNAAQSLLLLAGTYLVAIVGNLISLTYVDRIPRNVIFTVGILAVTSILCIITALIATFLTTKNTGGLSAAAAFIFLFLFTFNLFLEGPSWYYASELFPTHLRAKGMTIAVIGFCLVDILWLELAPTAVKQIGWKYYLVFICLSVCGAVIVFFTFPDTLHKPLEEVARLFGDDDLVAVYATNIHMDHEKHQVVEVEAVDDDVPKHVV